MPDYDPLTISDEELKQLPAAERAAVYKARRTAGGGAAPAPRPTPSSPPAAGAADPQQAGATPPLASRPPAEQAPPEPTSGDVAPPPASAAPATTPSAAPAAPAAAPRPAAPPPSREPEKPKEPPFVHHILERVEGSTFQWRHGYAELKVPRERLLDAAKLLKADGFDYLSFITEVDWLQNLELIYHVFAYDYRSQPLGAILRCELPREGMPEVASLTSVWPGAEFMEREAFEMMGISFLGHPDLRRILLPDDFIGFPMRRDFETDWDYITVKQLVHEGD